MDLGTAKTQARDIYNSWKTAMLSQGGMPAGLSGQNAWRVVRPGDGNDTVSEGIAYGLLLTAIWGNPALPAGLYDSGAQAIFDGLWKYYHHFKNANGIMDWKISASGVKIGFGGATDGDVDAAMALLMAHRIWGSGGAINYGAAATTLINAIRDFEITPANHSQPNVMKNGDMTPWTNTDQRYNPDYWFPAYTWEFEKHTSDTRWTAIRTVNNAIVNYFNTNFTTGMVPNECNRDGTNSNSMPGGLPAYQFGYNSVRLWRLYLDLYWNGPTAAPVAQAMANKLGNWSKGQVGGAFPGNLGGVYNLDGTGKQQPLYLAFASVYGAAACGSADSSNSAHAASILNWLHANRGGGDYFGGSNSAVVAAIMAGVFYPGTVTAPTTVISGGTPATVFSDVISGGTPSTAFANVISGGAPSTFA